MTNLVDCAAVTLVFLLPSKAIDKETNREGSKDASNRKDGNSDGPDCCEGVLGDGLLVAFKPRTIDEPFNDLAQDRQNKSIFTSKQDGVIMTTMLKKRQALLLRII